MVTRSKKCLGFVLLLISCMVNEVKAESSQKWQVYTEWPFNAAEAKRRQEETAKALGIPVEKTIDLGNGVSMEFVLIPAGRFIMGIPEPEGRFFGLVTFWVGAGILLVLVLISLYRARKTHRWPQFSLRYLLLMVFVCSIGLWGGVRWWQTRAAWEWYEGSFDSGKPAHEVTLSRPFYMGKYEVMQAQYRQVIGGNPSQFKGRILPMDSVWWNEAESFCKKVGNGARLPSEAEWEYACRAGTETTYCSGDSEADLTRVGWFDTNSGEKTHPVGKKESNAFGLYDMHGNVWEWCQDRYAPYTSASVTDPQGAGSESDRLLRGGAWNVVAPYCWLVYRGHGSRDGGGGRCGHCGFRVVVSAPRNP